MLVFLLLISVRNRKSIQAVHKQILEGVNRKSSSDAESEGDSPVDADPGSEPKADEYPSQPKRKSHSEKAEILLGAPEAEPIEIETQRLEDNEPDKPDLRKPDDTIDREQEFEEEEEEEEGIDRIAQVIPVATLVVVVTLGIVYMYRTQSARNALQRLNEI
jgi:hypothetical protein